MKALAIDTSGRTAGVALADGYIVIGEFTVDSLGKNNHSTTIMRMADDLLRQSGFSLNELGCVAYASGPGSFTGLRVGASSAAGLAKGAGLPLVPVPTLDFMAYNVASFNGHVMPLIDARRSEVYAAVYGAGGKRLTDFFALPIGEALGVAKGFGDDFIFLGDGVEPNEQVIRAEFENAVFAPPNLCRQRASSLGLRALRMLDEGFTPRAGAELLYLRKPQAEREREERCSR